ncbi:hypothetical protein [Bradyrhizobium genosp. SA-3]|uniref:hypothetical protein n=1 Tax=Bradyrhizobium genosp. SA-3 TaxID=508868 RepID=UPI0013EEC291|nr:hypothetical protein [Bradyrhizobium genosp. SA-3]
MNSADSRCSEAGKGSSSCLRQLGQHQEVAELIDPIGQTVGPRDRALRKGRSNAKCGSYVVCTHWSLCTECYGAGPNILQDMRGAAKGVHEELRRTRLQNRVPNVPQSLQEVKEVRLVKLGIKRFIAVLAGIGSLVALDAGFVAAENLKKLSGAQIRAKLSGKEVTDEVHYRDVYEHDGTLRSYAMGSKKRGKWTIQGDDLCIDLPEPDGGCFEVTAAGKNVVLTPKGLGSPSDGIVQAISDP